VASEGSFAMKPKEFNAEQLVAVLKQAEAGVPVADLIHQVNMSRSTFYRWRKRYVGHDVGEVRNLMQLHEDNTLLKQLVVDLSLDKAMLQDVLSKKF
jgi:putative transposase